MPNQPEERSEHIVRFLREQDGAPERELKSALTDLFRRVVGVQRAYLALAEYENPIRQDVVLGIRVVPGANVPSLVSAISAVFSKMFGRGQSLDIVALTDNQELHLTGVSRPFFTLTT
jgi:hypothetical protein